MTTGRNGDAHHNRSSTRARFVPSLPIPHTFHTFDSVAHLDACCASCRALRSCSNPAASRAASASTDRSVASASTPGAAAAADASCAAIRAASCSQRDDRTLECGVWCARCEGWDCGCGRFGG
eukprot:351524-Chlamydomonas_euryale.AAC.2